MNEIAIKMEKELPKQHAYNPFTCEHLPQCRLADELLEQMLAQQQLKISPIFVPKK